MKYIANSAPVILKNSRKCCSDSNHATKHHYTNNTCLCYYNTIAQKTIIPQDNKKGRPSINKFIESDSFIEYHSAIVSSSEDAIVSKDLNGIITSWNKAAERIFGYSEDEIIGKPITTILPDRLLDEEKVIISKIIKGEKIEHHETIRRRKDGKEIMVSISVSPIKDLSGKIIGAAKIARDITDRKQTEQRLHESEDRFRTLADNIPNLAWMAHRDGFIHWYNNRWYEYTGTNYEQMKGWGWKSVHDPLELPWVLKKWKNSIKMGMEFEMIFPLRDKNGEFRPFLTRVVPIKDARGNITQWFGTNTDITTQKEIERSLKESQDKLSFLADASKILAASLDYRDILNHIAELAVPRFADFCVFDILTEEKTIQRAAWKHSDHSLKEYIKVVDKFTPKLDFTSNPVAYSLYYAKSKIIPYVDDKWLQKAATSPEHLEFQRTLGYTSIISVPLRIRKKIIGVLTFLYTNYSNRHYSDSDLHIAEELAARAALAIENSRLYEDIHGSEERLRLALEAGQIGVWDWDILKDTILWSDEIYAFYGTDRNEFEVKRENIEKQVHQDDKEMAEGALKKALEGKQEYNLAYRIITLKGETRWISSRAVITRDEKGKPTRMLGATSDITEQRKVEQDKNDFVSIATHELKTPVTSIKAYAQVLQKKFTRSGDFNAAEHLQKMDAQLDKLTSLIGDLLDATKIESGQLKMHEEVFDFDSFIKEIVEELQRTTEKHKIKICGNTKVKIKADRERIGQVLTNLISNSIKYSPHSDKIIVKISKLKHVIKVCVQDFGVGIPENKQPFVFERFYRVSGPKGITFPGLGLGLFISSEIIKRHNGSISVKSEENVGSTFCFTLPCKS